MSKINVINYCGDCSHRYYEQHNLICGLMDKKTHENDLCPDWCPLLDYINFTDEELRTIAKSQLFLQKILEAESL
jgi:hypothetical protein